jgi:cytohesin
MLWKAVRNENVEMLEILLNAGADPDARDRQDPRMPNSPLAYAAHYNHPDMVEALLAGGADVKGIDDEYWPLHVAKEGVPRIHRALLEAGADPARKNQYSTIADGAVRERWNTPAHGAAGDSPEILRAYLEHGADPNLQNSRGQTLLMEASQEGRAENIPVLLEAGANLDAEDKNGKTALDHARSADENSAEVVRALQ